MTSPTYPDYQHDSLFVSPTGTPQAVSPEAQNLVEQGATPFQPDVSELLQQMRDLQNRVSSMQAERGIPEDPIAFAVANLRDHVVAHRNANPTLETVELDGALKQFEESPDENGAKLVELYVEDVVSRVRNLDLAYLTQLARDVRKSVLIKAGSTEKAAALAVRVNI